MIVPLSGQTKLFTQQHEWVLASGSPRRAALLRQMGFVFEVSTPDIDESVHFGEDPDQYGKRIVLAKLDAVQTPAAQHSLAAKLLIASDTSVICNREILGKPGNADHNLAMLLKLNGQIHDVITYTAIREPGQLPVVKAFRTQVAFRDMPPELLRRYARGGEGFDKAGGYAIQMTGVFLVNYIHGSYSNVVGFPIEDFMALALEKGWLI